MTWAQPASGPGVAAADEYLIIIEDLDGSAPPIVAEVPASQQPYQFQVPFLDLYTVKVYAFSQQAGASAPATATGLNENHES